MIARNRFYTVLAALLVVATVSGWAFATAVATPETIVRAESQYDDDIADANDEAKDVKQQLDELESDLEETDDKIIETNGKITKLEKKLPGLRAELDEANERLDAAKVQQKIVADKLKAAIAQDEEITAQIAEDEIRVEELKVTLGALAREQYRGEGTSDSLAIVFGAQTSNDFVQRFAGQHSAARVQSNALDEIEEIAAANRNRGARQEAVRVYIEELKVEADALVVEADEAQEVAAKKKAEVDTALASLADLRAELDAQRDAAIAKQKELERKQEQVRDQILDLVKKKLEEERKKNNAVKPGAIGPGYLSFPTAVPYITSSYGSRFHPVLHYWRMHSGTDLRAYCGTKIYAAAEGRVQWARTMGGFGNQVMVDHGMVKGNSLMTSYNHLRAFAVSNGQYVTRGQLLGYSGSTGTSTACHLHFEVYVNGKTVDPMTMLPSL